ncbi:hypothetical protein PR202_gb05893 [Eleusine coracana subsp. coracana]|uniref:Uncharacterized protein n=1 Tax=Eleusine coracana subsp. coracana TaxID=191504 RepID=A0AAV5E8A1_ELECO|nr:hypothetical protein PR202_gb05893 [Eleusine coracana subsp. coracana]
MIVSIPVIRVMYYLMKVHYLYSVADNPSLYLSNGCLTSPGATGGGCTTRDLARHGLDGRSRPVLPPCPPPLPTRSSPDPQPCQVLRRT